MAYEMKWTSEHVDGWWAVERSGKHGDSLELWQDVHGYMIRRREAGSLFRALYEAALDDVERVWVVDCFYETIVGTVPPEELVWLDEEARLYPEIACVMKKVAEEMSWTSEQVQGYWAAERRGKPASDKCWDDIANLWSEVLGLMQNSPTAGSLLEALYKAALNEDERVWVVGCFYGEVVRRLPPEELAWLDEEARLNREIAYTMEVSKDYT